MSKKRPLFRLPHPARFVGSVFAIAALTVLGITHHDFAQDAPSSIAVVDYSKLLPLLPEPPAGWTAEKGEGSTDDSSGAALSTSTSRLQERRSRQCADHIDQHSRFGRKSGLRRHDRHSVEGEQLDAGRLCETGHDRWQPRIRDLRERKQTRRTLGHGGETLSCANRKPGTGRERTSGMGEAGGLEEARGDQIIRRGSHFPCHVERSRDISYC